MAKSRSIWLTPSVMPEHKSLEAKDALVFQMRIYTADIFHAPASLGEVGIVNHQTGKLTLMVGAYLDPVPQLERDAIHQLAPIRADITQKIIKHVFPAAKQAA